MCIDQPAGTPATVRAAESVVRSALPRLVHVAGVPMLPSAVQSSETRMVAVCVLFRKM